MRMKAQCVVAAFVIAAVVILSHSPSPPVLAGEQSKLDERVAQLEKRLTQLEKALAELQQALKVGPPAQTIADEGEVLVLERRGFRDDGKPGEAEVYYRVPYASPPKIREKKSGTQ